MCKETLSIVLYPLHADLSCKNSERQAEAAGLHWAYGDAWEWIWDRFWSVTMYFNGMVPLPLDARCVYALTQSLGVSRNDLPSNDLDNNLKHQ